MSPARRQLSRLARVRDRLGRRVFGDRIGAVLFLGCLCFVTLYWRGGLFITDNATLQAALPAVADGHLWIEPASGDYLSAPGANVRDGYVYGRNYGQLVASLPALWALQAITAVANLHVALVAVWHLLALAFAVQLGRVLGHRRTGALAGGVAVLASFTVNVGLAASFTTPSLSLLALQATAAVAAGLVAVFLYRLVARVRTRRAGLVAGAGATVAMPIGFWATVPKRHVFSALVCVAILYAFVRSRESDGPTVPGLGGLPAYRAGAYALVGFLTWIHAAEGLFVFLALVLVDVPTAPDNDARTLAVVGTVFVFSMLPFFLTNLLVSGELVRPPRTIGGGLVSSVDTAAAASSGSAGAGGGGGAGGDGLLSVVVGTVEGVVPLAPLFWLSGHVTHILSTGIEALSRFDVVTQVFLRSNPATIQQDPRFLGVNLAVLEAAPALGAVVATGIALVRSPVDRLRDRVRPVDALAVALVAVFVLVYISRLPVNTQITVRDFLPLYPLGAYLLVRGGAVGHVVDDHTPALVWSYAAGVLVGGQLFLVVVVLGQYAPAEATRLHALLGLALGCGVAVLAVASAIDDRLHVPTAICLGLAAAAGTVFLLLSGLHYFSFVGKYILPVAGVIGDLLGAAG